MPGQFLTAPQCRYCCAKCPFCGGGRTIHNRYSVSAELAGATTRTGNLGCQCPPENPESSCSSMNQSLALAWAASGKGGSIGFFAADLPSIEIVTYAFPGKWCRWEGSTGAVTGCRTRGITVKLWLYEDGSGGVGAISHTLNTATPFTGGCGSESYGQGTTPFDPEADCAEEYSFSVAHDHVLNKDSWCTPGTGITYDFTRL